MSADPRPTASRFGESLLGNRIDALLHLLDRQVVDSEGAFVCKVDDVELTERGDGQLRATGLLTGAAALVARLGGDHDRGALAWWWWLQPARADRPVPGWIDLDAVEHLGSEVTLDVERDSLVHLQAPAAEGTTHRRLAGMLGMRVLGPDGTELRERVVDVRLEPPAEDGNGDAHPHVTSLLVGRSRPGTLMGYDRATVTRPVLIAWVLRWVNRHTAELRMDAVEHVDWDAGTVHSRSAPRPLRELERD